MTEEKNQASKLQGERELAPAFESGSEQKSKPDVSKKLEKKEENRHCHIFLMQIMSYFDVYITFVIKVKFMLGSENTVCCKVTQEEKSIQLSVQKLQDVRTFYCSR